MEGGPGSITLDLERKLNLWRFKRRSRADNHCKLSINYYFDLLKYVDDDYLSEWEILKFKDLYSHMLANMACQTITSFGFGFALSYIIMSPTLRSPSNGYALRMPIGFLLSFFLTTQSGFWMRPSTQFHEIMAQPNPHGSYIRKVVRYHFPKLWSQVSSNLHVNGYNLKEMNEYDKQLDMPEFAEGFDTARF